MPHFESISLDMSGSPFGLTTLEFKPNRSGNGVFFWRNSELHGSHNPAIRPTISMSNVMPSKTSKLQRTRIKIEIPIPKFDEASGEKLNVVDHLVACDVELRVPDAAVDASRNILMDVLVSLLKTAESQAYLRSLVVSGDGIYA